MNSNLFKSTQWTNKFTELYPELTSKSHLCKNITFIVTESCNLKCSYCYEVNKTSRRMTLQTAKDAIDYILSDRVSNYIDCNDTPGVILEFIGGEPLLEIDMIFEAMEYFKFKSFELDHPWADKYMVSISTNGLLYTSDKFQEFLNKNLNRVSVGITIDGTKEMHDKCRIDTNGNGSYDRVYDAVQIQRKQFDQLSTKVTLSHDTISQTDIAILHLFDIGIDNVPANVVFEDVWEDGDDIIFFEALIRLQEKFIRGKYYLTHATTLFGVDIGKPMLETEMSNWCGGNGAMLSIGVDGSLYPCIRFAPLSLKPGTSEFKIGDIYNGIDIVNPNLCNLCGITRKSQSTDECWNCQVAQGCAWCTGFNYDEFGTPDKRATYICKMHKARVLASYIFWRNIEPYLDDHITLPELHMLQEDIDRLTENKGVAEYLWIQ